MNDAAFFVLATGTAVLGAAAAWVGVAGKDWGERWGGLGIRATLLLSTVGLGVRWWERLQLSRTQEIGTWPVTNLYESLVFFAWATSALALWAERRGARRAGGAFILPWSALAFLYAGLGTNSAITAMPPALKRNWWIYPHVGTAFIGYASFAVAGGLSLVYLLVDRPGGEGTWRARLPERATLERLSYRAVTVGFVLLAVGILTGAAWANEAWGTYWSWDPKETWSLITWLIYAAYLHARISRGWRGRPLAWLGLGGFIATLFTYLGVNLVLSGLHSYGGG